MGAVSILRGINALAASSPSIASVASVEAPSFVASSLPSGTVLYSGAGTYEQTAATDPCVAVIKAGGSSYVSSSFNNSLIGVVRRTSGQVLVDVYAGREGQGGAGRPGRPSPEPFYTYQGIAVFPNYLGTATVGESDMIVAGFISYQATQNFAYVGGGKSGMTRIQTGDTYSNPSPILVGSAFASTSAYGTADPAQFGSTILEESRAAATAYPSGSMSISASGDRKGIIASFIK